MDNKLTLIGMSFVIVGGTIAIGPAQSSLYRAEPERCPREDCINLLPRALPYTGSENGPPNNMTRLTATVSSSAMNYNKVFDTANIIANPNIFKLD